MSIAIENTIAVELFSNMVNSLETKLTSNILKDEVKYNQKELNESISKDFNQITEVLQNVVDSFYLQYYQVNGFESFTLKNFNRSLKHNLELIGNAKKLIKYINK